MLDESPMYPAVYAQASLAVVSWRWFLSIPCQDAPDEFSVKTKDGDFSISHYPLEQSKFLFDMMEGKKKFGDAINKVFDYTMFRYRNGLEFLYFIVWNSSANFWISQI